MFHHNHSDHISMLCSNVTQFYTRKTGKAQNTLKSDTKNQKLKTFMHLANQILLFIKNKFL